MSSSRSGSLPDKSRRALAPASILAALALAGCGAHSQQARSPYEPPQHVAAPPSQVVMEDDGREAQMPPPVRVRQVPDDPREPWSRNYGTVPAAKADAAITTSPARQRAALPDDLPPAFRRQLVSALGD